MVRAARFVSILMAVRARGTEIGGLEPPQAPRGVPA